MERTTNWTMGIWLAISATSCVYAESMVVAIQGQIDFGLLVGPGVDQQLRLRDRDAIDLLVHMESSFDELPVSVVPSRFEMQIDDDPFLLDEPTENIRVGLTPANDSATRFSVTIEDALVGSYRDSALELTTTSLNKVLIEFEIDQLFDHLRNVPKQLEETEIHEGRGGVFRLRLPNGAHGEYFVDASTRTFSGGGDYLLQVTLLPEPSGWHLAKAALVALLWRKHRRVASRASE